MDNKIKCGVRFCGGCNPRYERGKALKEIEHDVANMNFTHAIEDDPYDVLLVIGGCPACCAAYKHFDVKGEIYKIWDRAQIEDVKKQLIEETENSQKK
jgi:hypothetical protein